MNILRYHLREIDKPDNPNKVWRGLILARIKATGSYLVASLEPGYENEREYVLRSQVVGFEDDENTSNRTTSKQAFS